MVDKYYKIGAGNRLTLDNLVIKIDENTPDWTKINRYLIEYEITGTVDNETKTIGKRYTLIIDGIDQGKIVSITIPTGIVIDDIGNENPETTINLELSNLGETIGAIGRPEENTIMAMGTNPYRNNSADYFAKIKMYSVKISNETGVINSYDATNNTGNGHSSSATTWKDLTGNNDGIISGAIWGSDYLQFDGVDDWVNLGQINPTNKATLETVIVADEIQSGEVDILSNFQTGGLGIWLENGYPTFSVYSSLMKRYVNIQSTIKIAVGEKTKIRAVYDGLNAYLYVNDDMVAQTLNNIGEITPHQYNTVLAMGTNPYKNSSSEYFAKIKMYSAKISDETGVINSHDATNNTENGHSSSITTWKDLIGNNNGIINGAIWFLKRYVSNSLETIFSIKLLTK